MPEREIIFNCIFWFAAANMSHLNNKKYIELWDDNSILEGTQIWRVQKEVHYYNQTRDGFWGPVDSLSLLSSLPYVSGAV